MKTTKRTLAALLAAIMTVWVFALSSVTVYSADKSEQKTEVVRFGGADRYETAALIADAGWDSSETVFLANSYSYADALAGAPLAYAYSAPILLTDGKIVSDTVMSRIKKLGAKTVLLLGGTAAVSEDVENKLKTDGYKVERVWGRTRYETALKIAEALAEKGQAPADIFIASGANYPDALSASSPAAIKHAPILYVPADGKLDRAASDFIAKTKPVNAYILGGTAAVGGAADNAVKTAGVQKVERLGGIDRYETSLKIAQQFDPQFKCDDIAFATGKNFPDALAGSVFAARESIPVLLTDNSTANDGVKSYIGQRNRNTVYIFGGQAVVSDSIVQAYLSEIPQSPDPLPSDHNYSDTWDSLPEDYKLVQMVVFSRHNIRSPLSGNGSVLASITPHQWFEWTSNPSELSLRGGVLETEMGQYFRKYLESQELIPENYIPEDGAVRFYANTKQRCVATAQYFSSGMLPTGNVKIESAGSDYSKMDPVFNPQFTFVSESYKEEALKQIAGMAGADGMSGIDNSLSDNYKLLADIIDLEQSEAYKNGSADSLVNYGSSVDIALYKEPAMNGTLKLGCQISDALVLQYYEQPDEIKAAFGKKLTANQWEAVSDIKDTYTDVLFTAPIVSSVVAHPLLEEIESEMSESGRKFAFLCGHDSNIASMLAALGVKDYSLPDTIERNTPIGSKVVFSTWENGSGQRFVAVNMVYQSTDQLRNTTLLTLSESPVIYPLAFNGIEADENGLYSYDAFLTHMDDRIDEYERIVEKYAGNSAQQAAA